MKIVSNIRYVIAEYLKYKYKLRQIGGDPEENITVAVDESLITHENGNQIWMDDYGNLYTRIENNGNIIFIDDKGNEVDGSNFTPVLKNVPIIV